jgi:AbrB family looped-hinge helix DNA binding protein
MATVTISPKYQVVIPQKIRESLGLRSGEKVRMISYLGRVEIIPERQLSKMRGYLKGMNTDFDREGDA